MSGPLKTLRLRETGIKQTFQVIGIAYFTHRLDEVDRLVDHVIRYAFVDCNSWLCHDIAAAYL